MRDRLAPLLARDATIAAATLALWAAALRSGDGAPGTVALHVLTGLLTVLCGYLVHEWGHLLGALARRSVVELPRSLAAPFLFNFDVGCNDRRQFNAMVFGGFAASLLFVALVLAVVPWALLAGKIAIALTVLGVAATFVFEVPTAWRVLRGAPLPTQGPAFVATDGHGRR